MLWWYHKFIEMHYVIYPEEKSCHKALTFCQKLSEEIKGALMWWQLLLISTLDLLYSFKCLTEWKPFLTIEGYFWACPLSPISHARFVQLSAGQPQKSIRVFPFIALCLHGQSNVSKHVIILPQEQYCWTGLLTKAIPFIALKGAIFHLYFLVNYMVFLVKLCQFGGSVFTQRVTYLSSLNPPSRYFNCESVELLRVLVIPEIQIENYANFQTYV